MSRHQVVPTSQQQQLAAEDLYRDANSLLYADNKPSEEAIDRVVGKLNREYALLYFRSITAPHNHLCSNSIDKKGKFSRKRLNEEEGDITYINERNRVFNRKV
jgi:pre-mRNA-splicing factor SYF2